MTSFDFTKGFPTNLSFNDFFLPPQQSKNVFEGVCPVSLNTVFFGGTVSHTYTLEKNSISVNINIEKGVTDNTKLEPINIEVAGKKIYLVLTLKYNNHDTYIRDGDDLVCVLKLNSFNTKGKTYKVSLDHPHGQKAFSLVDPTVSLEIIERGLGFYNCSTKKYGNHVIKFK